MPAPLLSKEEVIDRIVGVFRQKGYDGASLADLSAATGLGRSSLYHYFPGGKQDMALAAIDQVGQWVEQNIVQPLDGDGTPAERLARMLAAIDRLYAGGEEACLLGTLVLSGGLPLFQESLRRAFLTWIVALAKLLVEAGQAPEMAHARAEDAVLRIHGALVLAGGLGDPTPFRRVLARLQAELLA